MIASSEVSEIIRPTRYNLDATYISSIGRSYNSLLQSRLCVSCKKKSSSGKLNTDELMKLAISCCSSKAGFFSPSLPLMETAFRIFLSNGNRPLTIDEIIQELNNQKADFATSLKPEYLERLIAKDIFYGIKPVIEVK